MTKRREYRVPDLPIFREEERVTINEILRRESRIEENRKRYISARMCKNKYLTILGADTEEQQGETK